MTGRRARRTIVPAPAPHMRHWTEIVIYEEDDLTRDLLREWLAAAGYRVHIGTPCGKDVRKPLRRRDLAESLARVLNSRSLTP